MTRFPRTGISIHLNKSRLLNQCLSPNVHLISSRTPTPFSHPPLHPHQPIPRSSILRTEPRHAQVDRQSQLRFRGSLVSKPLLGDGQQVKTFDPKK